MPPRRNLSLPVVLATTIACALVAAAPARAQLIATDGAGDEPSFFDKMTQKFKATFKKKEPDPPPDHAKIPDPWTNSKKAKDPDADLFISFADVQMRGENYKAAESNYRRALEKEPNNPAALAGMAHVQEGKGEPEKAVEFYRQAIAAAPRDAALFNDLGLCLMQQGKFNDAVAAFEQAIALDPAKKLYRNNIARALVALGRLPGAYQHLSAVNDPSIAYYNLGYLLNERGDHRRAMIHFGKALEINPQFVQARQWYTSLGGVEAPPPMLAQRPVMPRHPAPRQPMPQAPQQQLPPAVQQPVPQQPLPPALQQSAPPPANTTTSVPIAPAYVPQPAAQPSSDASALAPQSVAIGTQAPTAAPPSQAAPTVESAVAADPQLADQQSAAPAMQSSLAIVPTSAPPAAPQLSPAAHSGPETSTTIEPAPAQTELATTAPVESLAPLPAQPSAETTALPTAPAIAPTAAPAITASQAPPLPPPLIRAPGLDVAPHMNSTASADAPPLVPQTSAVEIAGGDQPVFVEAPVPTTNVASAPPIDVAPSDVVPGDSIAPSDESLAAESIEPTAEPESAPRIQRWVLSRVARKQGQRVPTAPASQLENPQSTAAKAEPAEQVTDQRAYRPPSRY
ncbi:MAG: tetratricopeptide repeat protein [Pirellulales bacterium]|nr:tetratricopeptide repeat protein [Pirellulales bacterium]